MAGTKMQGEGHIVMAKGQKKLTVYKLHAKLIYHENIKYISCIVSE